MLKRGHGLCIKLLCVWSKCRMREKRRTHVKRAKIRLTNIVPQEFKRFNIDMSSQQPQASANFMYQTYSHPNVPYGPPYD